MTEATIVGTLVNLSAVGSPAGPAELDPIPDAVKWLNVRADLVGDLDPERLREQFSGNLVYTLRSEIEGGVFRGSPRERCKRLLQNAKHYDCIELEGERDLAPELLEAIPPNKRLISWQGPATSCSALQRRLDRFSSVGARMYKLVPMGEQAGDEIAALSFLKALNAAGRRDVIAYTTGKGSFWRRFVGLYLGMAMIFGTLGRQQVAPGEPTVVQLIEDYHLPKLMPLKEIYGIVGDPVQHSLSPRLHNAAYRALGYPAMFLPFHAESFSDFWRDVVEEGTLESLGILMKGFTVVSPHKEVALSAASATSSMVRRAGSTNIFVRNNGTWKADTTDPEGVVEAIRRRGIDLGGKRVAVVGCGGSGRPIAAAFDQAGAEVTLVNRGLERGLRAIELLGLPFVPLSEFSVEGFSGIVNAAPLGRGNGGFPFQLKGLRQ